MNERAKAKKQAELQKRFMEFQKKAHEGNLSLKKLEAELTGPILKHLKSIVEVIGKEKSFQLVLENSIKKTPAL